MDIKKSRGGGQFKQDASFRRKVCQDLLTGTITLSEACRKYNVKGVMTLKRWLLWYDQEQSELLKLQSMPEQPKENTPTPEEYRKLQEELKKAQLKVTTLETLIDIAEEQLHIDIRKKSGTKPSQE